MDCQICYEVINTNNFHYLECGHGLCLPCYAKFSRSACSQNCPFCRHPIKITNVTNGTQNPHRGNFQSPVLRHPILETTLEGIDIDAEEERYYNLRSRRERRPPRRRRAVRHHRHPPTFLNDAEISNITRQLQVSLDIVPVIVPTEISDKKRQKRRARLNSFTQYNIVV